MKVADELLDVLVEAGVRRIYGLVGDSLNSFSDAIRRSGGAAHGGLDWVHVHNEEAAAFAASAEAQLTGRLAVCAGSARPDTVALGSSFPSDRSARMSPGSTRTDAPRSPTAAWTADLANRATWLGCATVSQ